MATPTEKYLDHALSKLNHITALSEEARKEYFCNYVAEEETDDDSDYDDDDLPSMTIEEWESITEGIKEWQAKTSTTKKRKRNVAQPVRRSSRRKRGRDFLTYA